MADQIKKLPIFTNQPNKTGAYYWAVLSKKQAVHHKTYKYFNDYAGEIPACRK